MPVWIAFAIPFVLQFARETFKHILQAYQLITDRFADIGFSLFISLETENEKQKQWLLERYYDWLRIAIHACPAHFFILYNYDVIKADDDLKRFLMSDPYFKALWEYTEKCKKEGIEVKNLAEFLKAILIDTPLSFISAIIDIIVNNPLKLADEVCANLLNYINANPDSEQVAISKYLSQFTPDKIPKALITIPNEILAKLNPFLAILSPQILAHIKAMYAYSKVIHYRQCPQPPRQLLEFLDCDVYVDRKHYATIKLTEDNILAITIPKSELAPFVEHEICFDYAGITKCAKYRYGIPLKLTLTDFSYQGGAVCNVNNTFQIGQDMADWIGDSRINCNSFYGDSYSLMWWEIEHTAGNTPLYIRLWCGAYREACYGTATLYVGYRDGDKIYLTPITEIPYTWTQPGQITLYGVFPSPRFVIALYHYCYNPTLTVTGVRLIRHEAFAP